MSANRKGTVLQNDYWLARDGKGEFHWYSQDPLKTTNRRSIEVAIEEIISDNVGVGDIANPVMVRFNCLKVERSSEFDTSLLGAIRNGSAKKHLEDFNGNIVTIAEVQSADLQYPLNGIVYDANGYGVALRKYSPAGLCSDNEEDHRLIVVDGDPVFANPGE